MAKKTIYVNSILNFEKIDKITKNSYVYYGQYINGNKHIFRLMRELTDNKFEFGVIAQNILHRQWVRGKLLTYGQLAKEWLKDLRTEQHPEWKYIDFIRQGNNIKDWKKTREQIAKKVLKQI